MNKATYEAMTREELREYLRKKGRKNDEAWEVFFDKLDKIKGKATFTFSNDPQEFEKNLNEYLEHKRNS